MAEIALHHSEDSGIVKTDWLQARYSFSFGGHFDPDRIHFGALRVLNDEKIAPRRGFRMHPHTNMEIATLVLAGSLDHQDSLGNQYTLQTNEMQVISAGSGIVHSEKNPAEQDYTEILQFWIDPHSKNITPRYSHIPVTPESYDGKLRQIISPDPQQDGCLWMHQNAWVHIGRFNIGATVTYTLKHPQNGVYIFILHGILECYGSLLGPKDALGVTEAESVTFSPKDNNSSILIVEVPM